MITPKINWELCTEDISVIRQCILVHAGDIKYAAPLATFYRTIFCVADCDVNPVGYAEVSMAAFRVALYAVHDYLVKEHPDCHEVGNALNTADIVLLLLESGMLHSMDGKLYLKHIDCMKLID